MSPDDIPFIYYFDVQIQLIQLQLQLSNYLRLQMANRARNITGTRTDENRPPSRKTTSNKTTKKKSTAAAAAIGRTNESLAEPSDENGQTIADLKGKRMVYFDDTNMYG